MRNLILFTIIILSALGMNAQQSNLVFYTEQGEAFFLYLNGNQQNKEAVSNLMITNVPEESCKVTIRFAESALGTITKTLNFAPGTETSYIIRMNNNDAWVIRYIKELPSANAPVPPSDRTVIAYKKPAPVIKEGVGQESATGTVSKDPDPAPVSNDGTKSKSKSGSQTGTVSESGGDKTKDPGTGNDTNTNTNTNTNTGNNTQGGDNTPSPVLGPPTGNTGTAKEPTIIINMNVGNVTTTSNVSGTAETSTIQVPAVNEPVGVVGQPNVVALPGYAGPVGCAWPMAPADFSSVKNSISSKSFEDSKLTIAKQVVGSNCLLCSQVKEIMLLFSFEDTRLDFAKFAYGHTYDIGNYYMLNDAFTFESSIDELNEYIGTMPK